MSLKAKLDDFLLCIDNKPNQLETVQEALRVQKLVETMLARKSKNPAQERFQSYFRMRQIARDRAKKRQNQGFIFQMRHEGAEG